MTISSGIHEYNKEVAALCTGMDEAEFQQ